MKADEGFVKLVIDAYKNLYDIVLLREHELAAYLIADEGNAKERGWQLHHMLLETINEIDPGPQTPTFSREWRRHRLLWMRYVDALVAQTVADKLGISRRQYYREHNIAIQSISDVLWVRRIEPDNRYTETMAEQSTLIRRETDRFSSGSSDSADFFNVLSGCLKLLQDAMEQRQLTIVEPQLVETVYANINRTVLRQMIMGMLGYMIEHTNNMTLYLQMTVETFSLRFSIVVEPPDQLKMTSYGHMQARCDSLNEIATLYKADIQPVTVRREITGLQALFPIVQQRTILVVDDNEDVLSLFERILTGHCYRVITVQSAQEAFELAVQEQPNAITLDLMMPEQDGWDVLQALKNSSETQHIPVIICSVVKQRELSQFLGAAGFLEKPITEEKLLSALRKLEEVRNPR